VKTHGPWTIKSSKSVYQDPWIEVTRDEVTQPDGNPGTYAVVTIKPGVSVLPISPDGTVYLTNEFHYAVGRNTLETVSGGREDGEAPLISAQRELQEELGILAETWTHMGTVDPFTSNIVSPAELYIAEDLTFAETSPDATEIIQCVEMSLAEAVQKVLDSEITHAPSGVLILKAARLKGV